MGPYHLQIIVFFLHYFGYPAILLRYGVLKYNRHSAVLTKVLVSTVVIEALTKHQTLFTYIITKEYCINILS